MNEQLSEQDIQAMSAKMADAIQAAVDECKEVIIRHAETLDHDGAKVGVVMMASCHVAAAMMVAGTDPRVLAHGREKANQTRSVVEDILVPALERLYEVTANAE